jgi:hypothetical protein
MDALPSLPSLTPDNRYWRVDWFGECAYPGGVRRYAQPSIRVALSPLRCDPNDHAALLSPDCTDHQHPHEVWPPVAALPLLAIGDIWHEGRHVASPDYQVERFQELRITPDTSAFVKAGLALDEHFLLPLGHHPWHRNHTHSYCVAVTLDDGRRLLVPCFELIRFYFGSSSNLLQRLFTAPLRPEKLWASKRLNPENRHLHIVLANGLSGASATDIGRVAESGLAWRAAAGIYASCQKATAQRHPAYPYTGFPFEGTTNLEASGAWLPFGDQADMTFLVYRLRSCSFPFPFHSLSYEASDRKAWWNRNGGKNTTASRGARKKAEVAGPATDGDPGTKKAQRRSSFRDRRQFPDLARKQIWREKVEAIPKADVFLRHADGRLEQVAFGEGDGCSDAAGVDANEVPKESFASGSDTQLPRFVSVALKTIASAPGFPSGAQLVLVRPSGKQEMVFSLPVVVDEEGVIADRLLHSEPNGRVRQRRACFVETKVGATAQRYLLVVEGKTRATPASVLTAAVPSLAEATSMVLGGDCDESI